MNVVTKVTRVKGVIFGSLATQHPVKLVAALALGAGLLAMTALQFAPGHTEKPDSESVRDQAFIIGEYDDNLVLKDGRWEVQRPPEESSPIDQDDAEDRSYQRQSADEYRFMDLEDEPLSVEDLLTYVYPEERPGRSEAALSHQQEIERLEGEISTLLDEARQDPLTDPLELDRDLRNLDYQIDILRLAAMEQQ